MEQNEHLSIPEEPQTVREMSARRLNRIRRYCDGGLRARFLEKIAEWWATLMHASERKQRDEKEKSKESYAQAIARIEADPKLLQQALEHEINTQASMRQLGDNMRRIVGDGSGGIGGLVRWFTNGEGLLMGAAAMQVELMYANIQGRHALREAGLSVQPGVEAQEKNVLLPVHAAWQKAGSPKGTFLAFLKMTATTLKAKGTASASLKDLADGAMTIVRV